jgi:hypothetical protein
VFRFGLGSCYVGYLDELAEVVVSFPEVTRLVLQHCAMAQKTRVLMPGLQATVTKVAAGFPIAAELGRTGIDPEETG